jgi:hypothetical protein
LKRALSRWHSKASGEKSNVDPPLAAKISHHKPAHFRKDSMRVTVMMDVPGSHRFRRSNATLQRFTTDMLELDRRVADLELPVESIL